MLNITEAPLQSGIHPKLAQSLARHSTITLTMDRYAHVRLYDQAEALTSLPSLLLPGKSQEGLAATGTEGGGKLDHDHDQVLGIKALSAMTTDGSPAEKGHSRLDRALT